MTESRIQSDCFTWHWNTFPHERGQLFMVYNTPKNAAHGSILKAMGMLAGASDLIYLASSGKIYFLECKKPGGIQSDAQQTFERNVRTLGHYYLLFYSLEQFQGIIRHAQVGQVPASHGAASQKEVCRA
jgi:p-aminobenzoyl-glutamate transporter AbgT